MHEPVKIFSAEQIRKADQFTIDHEPVLSEQLMERAASRCAEWIQRQFSREKPILVFCGPGNNGGDGLVIARLLLIAGYETLVYIYPGSGNYSPDFILNEGRLQQLNPACIHVVHNESFIPELPDKTIIIDALFGTGLSKPVTGLAQQIISRINASGATIVSVDIPSGLFADKHSGSDAAIVRANTTLSFQFPKLAFFFAENAEYTGNCQILPIGLNETFIQQEPTMHFQLTGDFIKTLLRSRKKFSHKGNYGHALLIAGSDGMSGAAVLAAKACLRSGVGLLSVQVPASAYTIMQITNPEAMVLTDSDTTVVTDPVNLQPYNAVGIGPGIRTGAKTQEMLLQLLKQQQPLVIDADALNILGLHKDWLEQLPEGSVLTPHPKEFERMAGKSGNDFERHEMQLAFSKKYKLFLVLKGAHTCITTPEGNSYFNTTGNPGMAKGGSGDVLTGIITSLLAQGYTAKEACLLGVYIHGAAGDLARNEKGETGMIAGDLCEYLPAAFKNLNEPDTKS
jgi:NAD(P)H-hydrate epimerase